MDTASIERQIRARLSDAEYRLLQARLTHARKAIETLRTKLPGDLVEQLVQPLRSALGELELHERENLTWLMERLVGAGLDEPTMQRMHRQLRLVIDREN